MRNLINPLWDRWVNLHPFLRFSIFAVVAAAVGLFGVKPAYHVFKAWRVERNLVAAQQAVKDVRMDEARDLSLTVLRAGDPRIEAIRILEESTAALRDPRHGDIARGLMAHPGSSANDRWRAFSSIAVEMPLGVVGQVWTTLPDESRREPRFAVAFADRLLVEKRYNEAASVLLQVAEARRPGAVERGLVRTLIGSGKKQGYDEAQRMIASGFSEKEAGAWLDVLETIPAESLQPDLLAPVRAKLTAHSQSDARAALMVARLDYAADPGKRSSTLDAAIARWKESDPLAVAKFLRDLGLDRLLLKSISPDRISAQPELFPVMLRAMERADAWVDAGKLLDAHGADLPKWQELAHRAFIEARTGNSGDAVGHWSAAVEDAKSAPTALLDLSRLAREVGTEEQAEQALTEAIRLGRGPLPLYADFKELLSSLASQNRENVLLEVCAIYLSFEPRNPVLLTQYAYLACLNNVADPKAIIKAMEPVAKGFPKEIPIQIVLAAAYLCDHQPVMAAATLDPLHLIPEQLAPGYRAVFLVTNVLNGRLKKTDPKIKGFPWKDLQLSERKKFTELLAGVQGE